MAKGSPPRMRGEVSSHRRFGKRDRITPAHAGRRKKAELKAIAERDHPRACGEKTRSNARFRLHRGSPPRMRGEGQSLADDTDKNRITPAHAGRSGGQADSFALSEDHPRACGEKFKPAATAFGLSGSPPRMRGEDGQALDQILRHGITPAHAGRRHWPLDL